MSTTTEQAKHTPGKWRVRCIGGEIEIVSDNDDMIASMGRFADDEKDNEAHANSQRICRAVNAHDDLLAACELAVAFIGSLEAGKNKDTLNTFIALNEAVNKAKAQP